MGCFAGKGKPATLTSSSLAILQHYVQVTGPALASVPAQASPFMNCFLPLACNDDFLMHAILALSGTHLAFKQQPQEGVPCETMLATFRHYSAVISNLRAELARLNLADVDRTLRLVLVLLILCHYEVWRTTHPTPRFVYAQTPLITPAVVLIANSLGAGPVWQHEQ